MKQVIFSAIGEAMAELSPTGDGHYALGFAGDVFNTLVYARKLAGAHWRCRLVSALGNDSMSAQFREVCDELAVELDCPDIVDKSIGLYLIHTDASGERSFSYWRSDSAARQTVNHLDDERRNRLEQSQLVLISGISLAILDEPQRDRLLELVNELRSKQIRVVFDPNYRPRLWQDVDTAKRWIGRFYDAADILMIGLDEHDVLFGKTQPEELLMEHRFKHAHEIVIKAGPQGVYARCENQQVHRPLEPVADVVDTTAAGDSFSAGWLVAREHGLGVDDSARFAAAVAAAVIGHRGAIVADDCLPKLGDFLTYGQQP